MGDSKEVVLAEQINLPANFIKPSIVLEKAKEAAVALQGVIRQKNKPVIFNGEQYLEFEDWQTLARFYNITASCIRTNPVSFGSIQGWEAHAAAIDQNGVTISEADSMCLNDEPKWSTRTKYEYKNGQKFKVGEEAVPQFQLRSMAQTRACSKVLRNVLAFVAVLAGYKSTPAEEITSIDSSKQSSHPQNKVSDSSDVISEGQGKRLYAIYKKTGWTDQQVKDFLLKDYGYQQSKDIKKTDYEAIVKRLERGASA